MPDFTLTPYSLDGVLVAGCNAPSDEVGVIQSYVIIVDRVGMTSC